jgi:hypothetical protein
MVRRGALRHLGRDGMGITTEIIDTSRHLVTHGVTLDFVAMALPWSLP